MRSCALEWAHAAVHTEHRLIKLERFADIVRRVDSVHQTDDAGFVRRIRHRCLGADKGACKKHGCGGGSKNTHRNLSLLFVSAEDTPIGWSITTLTDQSFF